MNPFRHEIMSIEVHTQTAHEKVNLAEELEIDNADIATAYSEQPGKFAYWATVALQARFAYERKKQEVNRQEEYLKKTLYGELDSVVRQQMELDGEKITEARVNNAINTHESYLEEQAKLYELQDELLGLQQRYLQLEIAKESMDQRKDMLISLGAHLRAENNNTQ